MNNKFENVLKKIRKNKKKLFYFTICTVSLFIFTFFVYNLNNPTYFNRLFANILNVANPAFKDEKFYECIISQYNSSNGTSYSYTKNLTDDELKSITSLNCSGIGIEDVSGIEKLVNLTQLNLTNNNLKSIDLSSNVSLTTLDLSNNPLSIKEIPIMNIGDTYSIDDIKLPDVYTFDYNIYDSTVAKVEGNTITALKDGVTNIEAYIYGNKVKSKVIVGKPKLSSPNYSDTIINDTQKYIYIKDQEVIAKGIIRTFNVNYGELKLSENEDELSVIYNDEVLSSYKIIYIKKRIVDNYITNVSNNLDTLNINTVNCTYKLSDDKKTVTIKYEYNGEDIYIDEINLINIYIPKKYRYIESDGGNYLFLKSDGFNELSISNINDISEIDESKVNILNGNYFLDTEEFDEEDRHLIAKFLFILPPGEYDPENEEIEMEIIDEMSVIYSISNNYNLSNDYIYLGTKEFENDIELYESITLDTAELQEMNMFKLTDDSISIWLTDEECTGDKNNEECIMVQTNKIDEWKFIKVNSDKYDLSEDTINLNNEELELSKINVTNATLKVDNDKLLVMYGNEKVKEFKLVGMKPTTTTTTTKTTTKTNIKTTTKSTAKETENTTTLSTNKTNSSVNTTTKITTKEENVIDKTSENTNEETTTKNKKTEKTKTYSKSDENTTVIENQNGIINKISNIKKIIKDTNILTLLICLFSLGLILFILFLINKNKNNKS